MQITFEGVHGNSEIYFDCLNILTGDQRGSFLDIGCNHAPFTSQLGFDKRHYIDILPRELDNKNEQQYFEQADAIEFLSRYIREWDVIYSLDQIEHVTKEYGDKQLRYMYRLGRKFVLFTPLDEWMMTDEADKNPESHRSIWKPYDFNDKVIKIIFPVYHKELNIGAWFLMKCEHLELDFERVKNELKQKSWAKSMILS